MLLSRSISSNWSDFLCNFQRKNIGAGNVNWQSGRSSRAFRARTQSPSHFESWPNPYRTFSVLLTPHGSQVNWVEISNYPPISSLLWSSCTYNMLEPPWWSLYPHKMFGFTTMYLYSSIFNHYVYVCLRMFNHSMQPLVPISSSIPSRVFACGRLDSIVFGMEKEQNHNYKIL